ncbi:MAG: hypothetical protein JXA64_05980 [Candidatus Fermentibacteraceae bacterium]|nr:hypothetical protein [Candidatus Fermentibacteraceae bacterium]MBN2608645.1 hypothetical protein [Candidatus Fermentibacteraceae bacterium]
MKKAATIVLFLSWTLLPGLRADYWHGDFTDDRTFVFSGNSPIYSSPDTGSEIVVETPAGTEVHISGSAGEALLDGGFMTYWYQVRAVLSGIEYSGYMPGSSLAMTAMQLGADTLFMFSVTGSDPDYGFRSSARILSAGMVLDEVEFRPVDGGFGQVPYSYSVRSLPLDPEGLQDIRDLVELSFIYEACGFLNRDILFAWTGERLIMGPEADSQFEASEYRYIEDFIMPSDSGGSPGTVMVRTTISEWDEEIDDYVVKDSYSTDHGWTGAEFESEGEPY